MAIRVTCPGCHTRFNVSDHFAGRNGPCPKCKATIRIPDKSEEVVIHAPKESGAKDAAGASLSKPIFRQELVISPLTWSAIIGVIATIAALALLLRYQYQGKAFPLLILAIGALLVAVPAVYGAYGMLRDSELGAFIGRELWIRVAICAAAYAALWLGMPIASFAMHGYDTAAWSIAMAIMIGLGGGVAMSVFDFDYLVGVLHYGMYLGCTLMLRWILGVGVFPGQLKPALDHAAQTWLHAVTDLVQRLG